MAERVSLVPGATGNLFLDALSRESAEGLLPLLDYARIASGAVVATAGAPILHVLFPVSCVISNVARMRDGSNVEILLTGREGFFGIDIALGNDRSNTEAVVQIPDGIFRIAATDFRIRLEADAQLRARALRYTQATIDTVGQFAACNRLHPIAERCARWLLMAHDRINGDEIALTHEVLAAMLGVHRPGVSVAVEALEAAGIIELRRGRFVVMHRLRLESASCECYDAVNVSLTRHLGYDVRKRT